MALSQSSGRVPLSSDIWKMICNIGAIAVEHSFITLAGKLSGPEAFFTLISLRSFSTPAVEMLMEEMSGVDPLPMSGTLVRSSVVKTEQNCLKLT